MKKSLGLLLALLFSLCLTRLVRAADVDYRIDSYLGMLEIAEDNSARFTQEIDYSFESSYNGQYVTLGQVDPLPANFKILDNPQVEVTRNGSSVPFRVEESVITDGKQLKIYDSGSSGDQVKIRVTWQIQNFLSYYRDIVEMNWFPISDWDEDLEQVRFQVRGLGNTDSELVAHRGFFQAEPNVKKVEDGYDIEVGTVAEGQKLELHAYWPRAVLASSLQGEEKAGQGKTRFEQTESSIRLKTIFFRFLVYLFIPGGILVLILASFYFRRKLKRSICLPSPYLKDARLYEAPQDLPPLLVAQYAYNLSFTDAGPLSVRKDTISFENLIQASLLDLIDRGNVSYSQDGKAMTLKLIKWEGLTDLDLAFIEMVFAGKEEVESKQVFEQYQIDSKITKGIKTKSQEKKIREAGSAVYSHFKNESNHLSNLSKQAIRDLGLPPAYREWTKEEKSLQTKSRILFTSAGLLLFFAWLLLLFLFQTFFWQYLLALAVLIFLAVFSRRFSDGSQECLTQEGNLVYAQWESFNNMLASIARLDKTEIEAIVLWNRILVYATLFGHAKKVSKVMKVNGIKLPNPAMDDYRVNPAAFSLTSRVSRLNNYISTSSSASSFSISSSSGSGGFSGGGFSGGGGGGGGGAF